MSGLSQGVKAAAVGATTFGGLALITAVGLMTLMLVLPRDRLTLQSIRMDYLRNCFHL